MIHDVDKTAKCGAIVGAIVEVCGAIVGEVWCNTSVKCSAIPVVQYTRYKVCTEGSRFI